MHNITYQQKIDTLLEHYRYSTKLAEALGVSRISVQNWRDEGANISDNNKLNIDILFAKHSIIPSLTKSIVDEKVKALMGEDQTPYIGNIDIVTEVSKHSAFGSLEVEVEGADEATFYRVIEGSSIEKDIEKRKFLEMNNLAFLTKQILVDTLENRIDTIGAELIRKWHFGLMVGIREDAGSYSTKMRIIPNTNITLTAPEDIPQEVEYWVKKSQNIATLYDIAHAHEHFELIHPFGDGNGRVGRLIMAHQCIKNNILPPLIDRHNKALYYETLHIAQKEGNIIPLVYFLCEAIERMKEKLGIANRFGG